MSNETHLERARLERRLFWENTQPNTNNPVYPGQECIVCGRPATIKNLASHFVESETFWCRTHHEELFEEFLFGGYPKDIHSMQELVDVYWVPSNYEDQLEGWPTP